MPVKTPNPATYNPDPEYLKGLLEQSGLKQKKAAELIDLSPRMLRYYLGEAGTSKHLDAPYLVQFALECLAASETKEAEKEEDIEAEKEDEKSPS